ncbi:MAG: FAD-binding protein [Clostridia bacterium]|nr:FAD-binding protein [Clostridia bacterium]MDD4375889.1 FAD-binding protein [Clostridia bacterium]
MLNLSGIENIIEKEKIKYNEPMSRHTTFKIGGPADVLVIPETMSDIVATLKFAKEQNIPITVIGNGSKILVRDKGIRGIVIKIGSKYSEYKIDGEKITTCSRNVYAKAC